MGLELQIQLSVFSDFLLRELKCSLFFFTLTTTFISWLAVPIVSNLTVFLWNNVFQMILIGQRSSSKCGDLRFVYSHLSGS